MVRENKNHKIDLSIVIVNYKTYDLLDNCLNTIYKYHPNNNFEIIVVDNEYNFSEVTRIKDKFPKVIFILNKINNGFAKANNQALELINGEYILFLNNDIIFIENSIDIILDFVKKIEYPFILSCRLLNKDGSVQPSVFEIPKLIHEISSNLFLYKIFPNSSKFNKYHYNNIEIKDTCNVGAVTGAFLLLKTSLFKSLKGFDERFYFYFEEIDLCKRLKDIGGKVLFYPHTSVIHIGGGTAKSLNWFSYKNKSIATIKYYQKHFSKSEYILALLFHFFGIFVRILISFVIGFFTFNKYYLTRSYYYIKQLFILPKNSFIRK